MDIIIDYVKAKECKNKEAWFTCYKCGKCGRRFDNGFMINDSGTHPEDEKDDDPSHRFADDVLMKWF